MVAQKVVDQDRSDHVPTAAAFWRAAVAELQGDAAKAREMALKLRDDLPESPMRTAALAQFGRMIAPAADQSASATQTATK